MREYQLHPKVEEAGYSLPEQKRLLRWDDETNSIVELKPGDTVKVEDQSGDIAELAAAIAELSIELARVQAGRQEAFRLYQSNMLNRQRYLDEMESEQELITLVRKLQAVFNGGWDSYFED